ncbi:MAG: protein kinase [Proteobacteria bacterium]|nr:protein kinase [Pseudomonadota bacterium]
MQNSQKPSSSGSQTLSSQPFLQDSSLMTALPPSPQHQKDAKLRDQPSEPAPKKELMPLNHPSGQMLLDFTIRFEDLTFGDLLGQGAYGKVFSGEWEFNIVAIKQYATQDFSEQTKNEILKEAKVMAMASTQSDYLVRLRGVVLEKPHYSLVMEYMPGGDLFHLLKSSQELTWTMRYRISLDMTIGLHHLHQRDILHRDLKSFNVLLDMNFRAKLADFGLSSLKTSSASTISSGFKGTPLWSAPELFKWGAKATTTSDLYSLAVVFWELITRKIPFAGAPNPTIAIEWVKEGAHEIIPEDTPEEFKAIMLDCWHKTPEQRPAAAAVAKRLDMLWQTERKKNSISHIISNSSSLSMSSSASSALSSSSAQLSSDFAKKDHSLITFLDPANLPVQLTGERRLQPPPSGIKESKLTPSESISQTISQTILAPPKLKLNAAQLALQNQLIVACKQGDEKRVKTLLQQDAKPDVANAEGEHPLGAAIWGMCPDVIKTLLTHAGGIAPMAWKKCEQHNLKYYKEVFIISKFAPQTFGEWRQLLLKIDLNLFIRAFHLKKVNEKWNDSNTSSWRNLKQWVKYISMSNNNDDWIGEELMILENRWRSIAETEKGLVSYRIQIKQDIESAKQLIKQQNQAELKSNQEEIKQLESLKSQLLPTISQKQELKKESKELEYETPVQTPKSTPPLPSISQTIPQTLMLPPKPKVSPEQLALQGQLITACKQGDVKAVEAIFKRGAKPDISNAKGEQPLGAAVWGMCPDVVNALLKQAGDVTPMTWQECGKHNLKYYQEVFIVPKFDPQTFDEWDQLLQKMDLNLFIRTFHLEKADEAWHDNDSSSWENLKLYVRLRNNLVVKSNLSKGALLLRSGIIETGHASFRTQIKQNIESAKQPIKQQSQTECLVM